MLVRVIVAAQESLKFHVFSCMPKTWNSLPTRPPHSTIMTSTLYPEFLAFYSTEIGFIVIDRDYVIYRTSLEILVTH